MAKTVEERLEELEKRVKKLEDRLKPKDFPEHPHQILSDVQGTDLSGNPLTPKVRR
ncbi:MAG: hypothetical protein ACXABY_30980 [Candidatus Thorarchaeota archaeon]|jgi:hypothetical protein